MRITITTAKAIARKVIKELKAIKDQQIKEAEKVFLKDKKFKEYHSIQKQIQTLKEKRDKIVVSFEGETLTDSVKLVSAYQNTHLYPKSVKVIVREDEIYDEIMARSAFTSSDVSMEDFIKDLVKEYK